MKDKVIEVLGLGLSIQEHTNSGAEKIGVNDIWRYRPVHKLLLMDPPDQFDKKRLEIIKKHSHPMFTYSNLDDWNFMPHFVKINVVDPSHGGKVDTLDDWNNLPRHVDSTFTAVCIAYHSGASDIVMYGVDFTDHHLAHYKDQIIQSYSRLHGALIQRGVFLWLGTDKGLLSRFIPNWHKTMEVL